MQKSQHTRMYERLIRALREAREQAGLTQMEVVKKLGIYDSYVSKVESGERRIDVVELATLCRVYGIPLVDFLQEVGIA